MERVNAHDPVLDQRLRRLQVQPGDQFQLEHLRAIPEVHALRESVLARIHQVKRPINRLEDRGRARSRASPPARLSRGPDDSRGRSERERHRRRCR